MNADPFIQEVSDVYTSPFLDTDELKMALRAQKFSRAFKKEAPVLNSIILTAEVLRVVSLKF